MPELPETETIARELHRLLAGRCISGAIVTRPDVLRAVTPDELIRRTSGRRIDRVWRRAKSVVLVLGGDEHLIVTPRFTGAVLVHDDASVTDDDPYATVRWHLADGGAFVYRDVRRLGTVALAYAAAMAAYDERLGPEPLDPAFTAERLSVLLRGSSQAVKKVLMDQRHIAGIGNIYANEGLWRAGIDPSRPASSIDADEAQRLHGALVAILTASIAERGTTFRDYRDPDNRPGGYAARLDAYGRGNAPCRRCGARLIETHAIDGRTTVFCYRCQR